jgi:alpha-1,6-mannosyltransferase
MKSIPTRYLILAVTLELLFLLLCHAARSDRFATAIVLLLLAGAVYATSVYLIQKVRATQTKPLFWFIIAAAVVFRITLWSLAFPTTDDVYRYRWEGKLQAHGGNPYQVRPNDPEWAFLRDSTYSRVGLKEFKGGYGPAWELVSAVTYRMVAAVTSDEEAQAFWFKLPAAMADLGLIGAVSALLRALGMPVTRVIVYAWSPLPMWEFWANGHNDALVVLAAVLAILLAARGRRWSAAAALTAAIALKLWPAILISAFARRTIRFRHLLLCVPLLGLLTVPYWSGVFENARFMTGFVGGWRNNDSIFGAILWIAGDQYRAKYTAFALIGTAAIWIALRQPHLARACLWTIIAVLFLSSNCHPWYLTWFLPLLAIELSSGLLLWTTLAPLFYSVWPAWVVLGVWDGVSPWRWYVYVPVFVLIGARAVYDRRNAARVSVRQVSV